MTNTTNANGAPTAPSQSPSGAIANPFPFPTTNFAPGGPQDIETFRKNAKEMVDFMCDYYKTVGDHSTLSRVQPGYLAPLLPKKAPEDPESFESILADVQQHIIPGVTHWQSPNFFAFFPSNNSFPSLLGDMLSGMINCIGFNWMTSPACTELEMIAMDWLAKLVGLPDAYLNTSGVGGGVIQMSASDASVVAMIAARQRKLRQVKTEMEAQGKGDEFNEQDVIKRMVFYGSDEAHSCHKKGAMVLKLNFKTVAADDSYAVKGATLKKAIETDVAAGLLPTFFVGTIGSTSTGATDHLSEIGPVCRDTGVWLHVDAAWAGSAFVCPEHRELMRGMVDETTGEVYVDSYDFNPHKWLLVNFDCSAMWLKERADLVDALSIMPAYLRNKASASGSVIDYRDWQVPLGRRFRSLKLWFVMRSFGAKGLREHITKCVNLTRYFETLVTADDRFELIVPRTLALACFRIKPSVLSAHPGLDVNAVNKQIADGVNESSNFLITASEVKGKPEVADPATGKVAMVYFLRVTIGGWSEEENVRGVWDVIRGQADKVLAELR
ncbi:aromatic-L-amino-acid decarboxylase-like protein [Gonapodya prolifera JEL478]|uniref:Aromatic-L-amino-acid decarboxylase-like protein n=1 Tax=Gonapodya prolifera (strain JEL478) TaxID=1344416 RepID=A0A138ZZL4_GONPJ|nr:aromatic-L-amino-acid decarboxylase-like protein [Gonapodya prolifera JEL478]|eukprot:KXS09944.1 aromatic-L-amino-acid decarboxylase-like protein [Gonapodya prolifera JEL478]